MASKQKQRVGEVIRARGVLYDDTNGTYKLLKQHYTREELLLLLRTLGKRAQTRIKTLSRYFSEGGSKYTGEINPVFDRYRDFDIKYLGVSQQGLYQKVKTAVDILNSKQSTYTEYKKLQNKAFETMKKNHPKLKNMSFDEWRAMTTYMGQWQSAHEGEQYDSEQLLQYTNWASKQGAIFPQNPEDVDLDKWFLDVQREGSSGEWLELDQDFDDI